MNPIELIEKLIIEHGSAAVLKERLELLKDQISKLEKENDALKSENSLLRGQIKRFESEINLATKEINRLNETINAFQREQGTKKYDEVTEKILKLFFEAGGGISVEEIVGALSLDISKVKYHFDILLKDGLIILTRTGFKSVWMNRGRPTLYGLTPSGRKYVVENKIS